MQGLFTRNTDLVVRNDYLEKREICLVPYHVTYASLNKVKFYRDFNTEAYNEIIPPLEKEAQFTISKLKSSLLFRKDIIENITSDINKSERIIYFDIILTSKTTYTSFIEILEYLNSLFLESVSCAV